LNDADSAVVDAELVFVDDQIAATEIVAAELVGKETAIEDGRKNNRSPILYLG
jgi:hypothetical protein